MLVAATASANELGYDNALFGRANPLGVGDDFKLHYRIPLYASTRPLLAQNFVGPVASLFLSTVFARPGVGLELQPLSILHLYAGYEPMLYYGDLGYLHSYPTPQSDYPSGAFATAPAGSGRAVAVHTVALAVTLQLKVRFIGFRSTLRVQYLRATDTSSDAVFYDPIYDVLVPRDGWMLHDDADLVYISRFGLVVGVRHALTHVFYADNGNPNTPISRLGPVAAYTFFDHHGGKFDTPTLFLALNWYLSHRYRTGEVVNQGLPMIGIGFLFKGSLL